MNKPGKISVRCFLKKDLRSFPDTLTGDDTYPLYAQIIFKRKNIQFRIPGTFYSDVAFEGQINKIKHEEEIILQIAEYERKLKKEKFDIIGFSERYKYYTKEVSFHVDRYLRFTMRDAIIDSGSEYITLVNPTYNNGPVETYYKALLKLIDAFKTYLPKNFNEDMLTGAEFINWCCKKHQSPRLIEWLNYSVHRDYKTFLLEKGNSESQIIDKITSIDNLIFKAKRNY